MSDDVFMGTYQDPEPRKRPGPVNEPNRVIRRDEYFWMAVDRDNNVVATAARKSLGTLWTIQVREHLKPAGSRNATPHVRVSGKLPATVQTKLVYAILENA